MVEKKKRGRPKKEESVEGTEEVATPENSNIDVPQEDNTVPPLDSVPEVPPQTAPEPEVKLPSLADPLDYPQPEEEEAMKETEEQKKTDVRIPETKKDIGFWAKLFSKNKLSKEGSVAVILLHPTTDATLHIVETKNDGEFWIKDHKYHVNEHCTYSMKIGKERYPLCILPSWSMIPIGTKAWFEMTQERRGHILEMILVNSIKNEEKVRMEEPDKKKKGMSGKTIWIIIAVLVGGYIFLKSRGSG